MTNLERTPYMHISRYKTQKDDSPPTAKKNLFPETKPSTSVAGNDRPRMMTTNVWCAAEWGGLLQPSSPLVGIEQSAGPLAAIPHTHMTRRGGPPEAYTRSMYVYNNIHGIFNKPVGIYLGQNQICSQLSRSKKDGMQ